MVCALFGEQRPGCGSQAVLYGSTQQWYNVMIRFWGRGGGKLVGGPACWGQQSSRRHAGNAEDMRIMTLNTGTMTHEHKNLYNKRG